VTKALFTITDDVDEAVSVILAHHEMHIAEMGGDKPEPARGMS
jgi:hypothetical protein